MYMIGPFTIDYYVNMSWKNHFILQNNNTANWLKIQVDSIFIEQPVLPYKTRLKVWEISSLYTHISSLQK